MWGSNGQNKAGIGEDILVVMVLLVFPVVVMPLPLVPVRDAKNLDVCFQNPRLPGVI